MLTSRGINHAYSYHLPVLDGIKKTRVIDLLSGLQIVRLDNVRQFDEHFLEEYRFLAKCIDFNEFDCLVVSDYRKGIIDNFMVRKIQSFEKPVFVDTKNPDLRIWDKIKNCIIKINQKEFDEYTFWTTNCKVVKTEGKSGAILFDEHGTSKFSTEAVVGGDVTGAGDVFLAGLTIQYMKSQDIGEAINFANKAASESVKHMGTWEVYL
jgi:bifunctional ADP-heptose synthase (sugar kinase/adenylyltransferase)